MPTTTIPKKKPTVPKKEKKVRKTSVQPKADTKNKSDVLKKVKKPTVPKKEKIVRKTSVQPKADTKNKSDVLKKVKKPTVPKADAKKIHAITKKKPPLPNANDKVLKKTTLKEGGRNPRRTNFDVDQEKDRLLLEKHHPDNYVRVDTLKRPNTWTLGPEQEFAVFHHINDNPKDTGKLKYMKKSVFDDLKITKDANKFYRNTKENLAGSGVFKHNMSVINNKDSSDKLFSNIIKGTHSLEAFKQQQKSPQSASQYQRTGAMASNGQQGVLAQSHDPTSALYGSRGSPRPHHVIMDSNGQFVSHGQQGQWTQSLNPTMASHTGQPPMQTIPSFRDIRRVSRDGVVQQTGTTIDSMQQPFALAGQMQQPSHISNGSAAPLAYGLVP